MTNTPELLPAADDWMKRIPAPHPQTAATQVDGQAVIVLADSGQMLALNMAGTRLWELCDGRRSAADLVERLHAEYDVSLENARRDTIDFLQQLSAIGALIWVEAQA